MSNARYERDQRRHVRRNVQLSGVAVLERESRFACRIQDISQTGAMLIFDTPVEVPDDFMLEIGGNEIVSRRCWVVRRNSDGVGVLFPDRQKTR